MARCAVGDDATDESAAASPIPSTTPFCVSIQPSSSFIHRDGGHRNVGAGDVGDEDRCEEQQHDGVIARPQQAARLASPRALDMNASPDAMAPMLRSGAPDFEDLA